MSSRPVTPPPQPQSSQQLQSTPEHVRQIEINRLKAKASQREREMQLASSSSLNNNGKRPLTVTSASSSSPTTSARKEKSQFGRYFDYDLSKMVNSKGGFLVEDDKEVDEQMLRKEKAREHQRAMQSLEPPVYLDPSLNPKCRECDTIDIDQTLRKVFGCLVCRACQNEHPEKYSLLTKTECKEDYLLTDSELRDHEVLPHLLKANPHQSTYANMMLFLRCQVEDFAWKKWGSPEQLDEEYERRTKEKAKKKNKKFEESLRDLRRKTKGTVWQKRRDEEHKHVYGPPQVARGGIGKQVCHECGFTIEVEEL